MRLEGFHHVTAISADAPRNVDFYARLLGLRLVKKTVNFDAPDVYHLYYGSESGAPGSVMTFFEFPGAARGRAGRGMVHRVCWRVAAAEALDFWEARLRAEGVAIERADSLRFADPEGLELELIVAEGTAGLAAEAADIPPEHALQGFHSVRAYSAAPEASEPLLDVLGPEVRGLYAYDPPPEERALPGAGTVHHVAWACRDEDQGEWRARVAAAGAHVTPVIDRDYFLSIYFREPSGVLFEIATLSPGFAVDEPPERLGESLRLPRQHEHLRERLERTLTPLPNPRVAD